MSSPQNFFLCKRSNGYWYIGYEKPDGKRHRKSTHKKLKQEALEEEVERGNLSPPVIKIHSANVSARQKMELAIKSIERIAAGKKK